MLLSTLILGATSLTASVLAAAEPLVVSSSVWSNAQEGIVINGQNNLLTLTISNIAKTPVTVHSINSGWKEVDGNKFFRNATAVDIRPEVQVLQPKGKLNIPYPVHVEHSPPRDLVLQLWIQYSNEGDFSKETMVAYDAVLTVIEKKHDGWVDFQLILLYMILGTGAFFGGKMIYQSYIPQKKIKKVSRKMQSQASSLAKAATSPTDDSDWIAPSTLAALQPNSTRKRTNKASSHAITESSGAESSAKGSTRRGNKNK